MATAISGSEYGATAARDVPEGLPKFSPNANALLEAARAEASRRGHSIAGTEHVLWALLQPGCTARVLGWIESNVAPQEDGLPWSSVVLSRLEANPVFRPTVEASEACLARTFSPNILEAVAGAAAAPSPPVMLSQSLRDALALIPQFAGGPVQDGALTIDDGLVATEFILAAILLHSINTAADVLARVSRGQINSWRVCEAIRADPAKIHVERAGLLALSTFDVGEGARTTGGAAGDFEWGSELPDPRSLPASPTATSNWLLPGKLIIGAHPDPGDVVALMDEARVTTFVSLIGEYSTSHYQQKRYPAAVARGGRSASFVHFPVEDFYVPKAEELRSIVLNLKQRLTQNGEVVFVHCRGGHGRTGTVVIPLIAALFDIDDAPAADFVLTTTRTARPSDRRYPQWCHMPETDEQIAVCREVNGSVRLRTRKGRR